MFRKLSVIAIALFIASAPLTMPLTAYAKWCQKEEVVPVTASCSFPSASILINAGADTTDAREVFIDVTTNGGMDVMLSEAPDLHDAVSVPITEHMPFTLSDVASGKTVYAVVRGACRNSATVTDTIVYKPAPSYTPAAEDTTGAGGDDGEGYVPGPDEYADGTLLRGITSGRIYVIVGGQKRYIASLTELRTRYAGVEIIDVHDWVFDTFPEFWE